MCARLSSEHNSCGQLLVLGDEGNGIRSLLLKKAVGLYHRKLAVRDDGSNMADMPALHHDALDKVCQILSGGAPLVRLAL